MAGCNSPDLASSGRTAGMCVKCVKIDEKIAHYRRLAASITDQLTIDRIADLIREMQATKAKLHPEATSDGGG